MAENLGRDLALSDPMMQIGQWIANLGSAVQSGQVPQSIQDVLDYAKNAINKAQSTAEEDANSVYQNLKKLHIVPYAPEGTKAPKIQSSNDDMQQRINARKGLPGNTPLIDPRKLDPKNNPMMSEDAIGRGDITLPPQKSGQQAYEDNKGTYLKYYDTVHPVEKPFKTGRISTDDFANELKKKYPQLGKYNNVQIVNKILENRPDLVDKIDNPLAGDAAAAREQQRTLQQQQNQLAPAHAALSSLSGIGAILGSTAGLPGTMLGAGAGQGAQDFLENVLGISNTGGLTGAKNIGMSSLLAGVVPGAIEYASSPLKSTGALARAGSKLEDAFIPSKLRGWLKPPFLDYIANALEGEKGVDPLKAPMDRSPMFANEAELGAKPRFRINGNGTFTNTETGEVFDHTGNPIKATTPTQIAKPTSTSQSKFSLYGDKADIDKFIAQILAGK